MDKNCEKGCNRLCAHRTDGLCYWGGVAEAAQSLVDLVGRYIEPKKGDTYCGRNEVLRGRNELNSVLK